MRECVRLSKIISSKDCYLDTNVPYRQNEKYRIRLVGSGKEVIEIVGPNGSGKTTLLRNLWRFSHHPLKRILYRKEKVPSILFVPVDPIYQVLGPTVRDEIDRALLEKGGKEEAILIDYITSLAGVAAESDVLTLSFGQRKILALIIATLSPYPVLAFDEPFAGLDKKNYAIAQKIINAAAQCGKLVMVTGQEKTIEGITKDVNLEGPFK